ncbi:hypothetical protein JCM6882_008426 [Rhodosporidiobolus microsporus]
MATLSVYEAHAARKQASQHTRLCASFEDLAEEVAALLDVHHASSPLPCTCTCFSPIHRLRSTRVSPTWAQVDTAVGTIAASSEGGLKGVVQAHPCEAASLEDLLGQCVGFEHSVDKVKMLLLSLNGAVIAARLGLAAAPAPPPPPAPDPQPHAAPALPAGPLPTPPVDAHGAARSALKRSPTPTPPSPPEAKRIKVHSAEEEEAGEEEDVGAQARHVRAQLHQQQVERGEEEPLSPAREEAEGREVCVQDEGELRQEEAEEEEGDMAHDAEQAEQPPPVPRNNAAVPKSDPIAGTALTVDLITKFFSTLPPGINLSPPPDFSVDSELRCGFGRTPLNDIGGNAYAAMNAGTREENRVVQWASSRNFLCLQPRMNLCSVGSEENTVTAGQPVVFISTDEECKKLLKAVASKPATTPPKPHPSIHLFVYEGKHNYVYKGLYDVAHDGSGDDDGEPIPAGEQLHPELSRLLRGHVWGEKSGGADKHVEWAARVVEDWGFVPSGARDPQVRVDNFFKQVNDAAEPRRRMRFIVLRCIGWDKAAFDVWAAARLQNRGF